MFNHNLRYNWWLFLWISNSFEENYFRGGPHGPPRTSNCKTNLSREISDSINEELLLAGGHRTNERLCNLFISANTIRDGYLSKKGWEGGGGRQSKTSAIATIFHREGIVAMAGRVEVGFN